MTLGEQYNAEVKRIMPHFASDLCVDPSFTRHDQIDDHVFARGEYLGGMASAILGMIKANSK